MKKIWVVPFLLMFATVVFGQQVKKININELEAYIKKSDKPLLVTFWATWCAPCIEEIPYFQSTINNKYKGAVDLLLVSLDFKTAYPAKITAFANKRNFTAPIVWLNETNADVFCPKIDSSWSGSIPASVFINNKKGYKQFFERALTQPQLDMELKKLTE